MRFQTFQIVELRFTDALGWVLYWVKGQNGLTLSFVLGEGPRQIWQKFKWAHLVRRSTQEVQAECFQTSLWMGQWFTSPLSHVPWLYKVWFSSSTFPSKIWGWFHDATSFFLLFLWIGAFEHVTSLFGSNRGFSNFSTAKWYLNPILHGGGSNRPPLADYCTLILGGCPEWTDFSWLCSFQY